MSLALAAALNEIGARHKRTRPFRPQTNGKAERGHFNKTLLAEWAYVRRYDTNQARLDALPGFVDRYNCERPHGSLNGQPPMTVLVNNLFVNHSEQLLGREARSSAKVCQVSLRRARPDADPRRGGGQ